MNPFDIKSFTIGLLVGLLIGGFGSRFYFVSDRSPVATTNNPDQLELPTDTQATEAVRQTWGPNFDGTQNAAVVKLGVCRKGSMTAVSCGADIDPNGKGIFKPRIVGFEKTPTAWKAIILS